MVRCKAAGNPVNIYTAFLFVIIMLSGPTGCAGLGSSKAELADSPRKTIYLVAHDWHAGIVVRKVDIPDSVWPQHHDFPVAEYLKVGWGDADFYQAREINSLLAMKAVLLPTAAVVHVVGFSGAVTVNFPFSDIMEITVSIPGFERLCRYIEHAYAEDEYGRSVPLGPGLYGNSRFYASSQNYHLCRTCNVWSAGALKEAGLPVSSWFTFTVDELIAKAVAFGTVIQSTAKTK
ncbi:MAG: DUF2459 domain-containing protein [Desulfopila sp.]